MWLVPKTAMQKRRLKILAGVMISIIAGVCLLGYSFKEFAVYYYTPTEAKKLQLHSDNRVYRLGGVVVENSVISKADHIQFMLRDDSSKIQVNFAGVLPSLFREGSGAVAEGHFSGPNLFIASSMLAKHDENYKPPE